MAVSVDLERSADFVSVFHVCDWPAGVRGKGVDALAKVAFEHRLQQGEGGLAMWPLLALFPQICLMGVEAAMNSLYRVLTSTVRLSKRHDTRRFFLAGAGPIASQMFGLGIWSRGLGME